MAIHCVYCQEIIYLSFDKYKFIIPICYLHSKYLCYNCNRNKNLNCSDYKRCDVCEDNKREFIRQLEIHEKESLTIKNITKSNTHPDLKIQYLSKCIKPLKNNEYVDENYDDMLHTYYSELYTFLLKYYFSYSEEKTRLFIYYYLMYQYYRLCLWFINKKYYIYVRTFIDKYITYYPCYIYKRLYELLHITNTSITELLKNEKYFKY